MPVRNRIRLVLAAVATSLVASACTEINTISSNPPGAKVTINSRMAGITPFTYEVRHSEWPTDNRFRYIMELKGYETKEGEFRGRVTAGRVIGSIFTTAGFSLIGGGAVTLPDVEETLQPLGTSQEARQGHAPTAERLQKVNDLFEQGLITEQERKRLRADILNEEP